MNNPARSPIGIPSGWELNAATNPSTEYGWNTNWPTYNEPWPFNLGITEIFEYWFQFGNWALAPEDVA